MQRANRAGRFRSCTDGRVRQTLSIQSDRKKLCMVFHTCTRWHAYRSNLEANPTNQRKPQHKPPLLKEIDKSTQKSTPHFCCRDCQVPRLRRATNASLGFSGLPAVALNMTQHDCQLISIILKRFQTIKEGAFLQNKKLFHAGAALYQHLAVRGRPEVVASTTYAFSTCSCFRV